MNRRLNNSFAKRIFFIVPSVSDKINYSIIFKVDFHKKICIKFFNIIKLRHTTKPTQFCYPHCYVKRISCGALMINF